MTMPDKLNATQHPVPRTTLPALFERQVHRVPGATAVVFDGMALSYAELDARASRLARSLAGSTTFSITAWIALKTFSAVAGSEVMRTPTAL